MLRRTISQGLAVFVVGAMSAVPVITAHGSEAPSSTMQGGSTDREGKPGSHAGPPYDFVTELTGQFVVIPLKDQGQLTKTEHGYRFRTGQQDSHLVVTVVDGGLSFVDTGTQRFKKLSPHCDRTKTRVGIAAVCKIPDGVTEAQPLLVEVWPRLGNDFTDTSSLPSTFAVTVLGDEGNDTAHFGAGPDFFNGHSGRDRVTGGDGNDWIRAGLGNDLVKGGSGDDDLIAMQGRDRVRAGDGADRVGGDEGNDRLWGDAGEDFILCGTGQDSVTVDAEDRTPRDCETIN